MTDTAVCGPDPEIVDIALGFFLIVGTVAAYIPQVNLVNGLFRNYCYYCVINMPRSSVNYQKLIYRRPHS